MIPTEQALLRLQQSIIAGERQTEFPFLEIVDTNVLRETLFAILPAQGGLIPPLVEEAAYFAEEKLFGRNRKKGRRDGVDIPDVNHSYRVAIRLVEAGITDENTIAAALLHDTIEDSDTTEEELAEKFNPQIARTVVLLSKNQHNDPEKKKVRSPDYYGQMRNENEDEKVRLMAIQIKFADRTDNLSSFLIMDLKEIMKRKPRRVTVRAALGSNMRETKRYFPHLDPQNDVLQEALSKSMDRVRRKIERAA